MWLTPKEFTSFLHDLIVIIKFEINEILMASLINMSFLMINSKEVILERRYRGVNPLSIFNFLGYKILQSCHYKRVWSKGCA